MAHLPPSSATVTDAAASSPALVPSLPAGTSETQRQRERERRSRLNRIAKFRKMEAYAASLERTALALRVAPDADSVWDEFLDDDTKRMRGYVRRLISVTGDVKRLASEKAQLQRLLTEHELARRAVARLLDAMETTDRWGVSCARWKKLAKIYFRPLTASECIQHIAAALLDMAEYMARDDKQSSGLTVLGWHENRRVVSEESSLQFSLHKTYQGYDLERHVMMTWRVYTEPELYSKAILGGRARVSMDILQHISPTACVVSIAEMYEGVDITVHELYLFFRVNRDDGVIVYLRSIVDGDLQSAINSPSDLWTANDIWMHWEVLDPLADWTATDYRVSVGGCLRGGDSSFLHRWLFELVAAVVRLEGVATGRPMLKF